MYDAHSMPQYTARQFDSNTNFLKGFSQEGHTKDRCYQIKDNPSRHPVSRFNGNKNSNAQNYKNFSTQPHKESNFHSSFSNVNSEKAMHVT